MIKGGQEDDAALCTSEKTYNIRSVTLSNSVLLVSPSPHIDGSENQVVIQDSLNELLEFVLAVPKLHRTNAWKWEDVACTVDDMEATDRSPASSPVFGGDEIREGGTRVHGAR